VAQDEGMTSGGRDPTLDAAATPFRSFADPVVEERMICPFLAGEGPDGWRVAPIGRPDPANLCMALGEPQPQSHLQQELVCLTAGHVNCPRYLRGVLLAGMPPPKARRQRISPAVIGSAIVLAAALAASFGFLIVRGGFDLPVVNPAASQIAAASTASPVPSTGPTSAPVATASPTPSEAPSPSTSPSLVPSATPSASPAPTPRTTPSPTPTSNRFALLTRCPSTPDCWIYTIRAGDNLHSIANWFGVSYSRMLAMNPGLRTPIHAGDKLRIPTPTR